MKRRSVITGSAIILVGTYIKPELTPLTQAAAIISPVPSKEVTIVITKEETPTYTTTPTGTPEITQTSTITPTASLTPTRDSTDTPSPTRTVSPNPSITATGEVNVTATTPTLTTMVSTASPSATGTTGHGTNNEIEGIRVNGLFNEAQRSSNSEISSSYRSREGFRNRLPSGNQGAAAGYPRRSIGTMEVSSIRYPVLDSVPRSGKERLSVDFRAPNPVRGSEHQNQKPGALPTAGEAEKAVFGTVLAGLALVASGVVLKLRGRKNVHV